MSDPYQPPGSAPEVEPPPKSAANVGVKIVALLGIGAAVFFAYRYFGDSLKLENLASKESELRQYQTDNPVLVYGCLLYTSPSPRDS